MILMANDPFFKMNPTIKAQWVAALRSGEYRQGREQLHTYDEETADGVDRHCCLGVLCDLAVKAGVAEARRIREGHPTLQFGPVGGMDYEFEHGELPEVVSQWAGLLTIYDPYETGEYIEIDHYSNPNVIDGVSQLSLAEANDDKGYDFTKIADLIEASL